MSLVGTLGRVALGVVVAKGVSKMVRGGGASSGGGLGGALSGGAGGGLGGGLGGMLGGLLGGQAGAQPGGQAGAAPGSTAGSGGLAGSLGSLLGGKGGAAGGGAMAGGLGGLLEQISGGGSTAASGASAPSSGSLGDLLNRSLQGEQVAAPDAGQEAHARLLIQAMVNAAKSDGSIDQAEQQKIVEHLGDDVTPEEREFVLGEMRSPLDVDGFVASVPRGAEKQVYLMSLMAIELDQPAEARYLDTLRKGMGLSESDADAMHRQLGVQTLYS